ncbi:MAG: hypothetical protein HYU69_05895 [Bacteroidetes bacterium]|nr:hypothetical protein [Bacteroidota bacterium]
MNVGKGHWIFALIFLLAFIGYMIWAYRKDKAVSNRHYRGSYFIILFMLLVLAFVYAFVKLKTG